MIILQLKYTFNLMEKETTAPQTILFEVLEVNHNTYDQNWHSTLHYHTYYELFYCLNGTGEVVTNLGQQSVEHNNLILINPYVEHTEYSQNQSLDYIVIGFNGPEIRLPSKANDNSLYFFNDLSLEYVHYFKEIIKLCQQETRYRYDIINYYLNIIMLKLHDHSDSQLSQSEVSILSPNINLAKNFLDNHYSSNITLDDIEKHTHLSKFHLSREFKKELKMAPMEYLNHIRFKHAKELLETTNLSINQIAKFTGFTTANYFSAKFKQSFGQSPRAYRRQQR